MNHSWKGYILTYAGLSIINSWFSPTFTMSWLSNCRMELRRDSTTPALPRGQPSGRMMKGTCLLVSHLIDSLYIYINIYIYKYGIIWPPTEFWKWKYRKFCRWLCVYIYIYICLLYVYIYTCIYVWRCVYMCICVYTVCVYMCIYVHICLYMCIY